MGMFDYLRVSIDKLPLTDEEKGKYGGRLSFQTKEFDCTSTELIITDEGALAIWRFNKEYLATQKDVFAWFGKPDETNGAIEVLDFHGWLTFGSYVDNILFDFAAKFTDGKLVEIKRL